MSQSNWKPRPPYKYTASLGRYDLFSFENTSQRIAIDRVILHPQYHDLVNDLSLMRLSRPVTFGHWVQPVCLLDPTRDLLSYTKGLVCLTVGYGRMANMMDAYRLQKIIIRFVEAHQCNRQAWDAGVHLKRGTVCVSPPDGRIGATCHGDSGGPDLCYDAARDQWLLVGTVSYGPAECDRDPGAHWLTVSTDLSAFRSWIVNTIKQQEEAKFELPI